MGILDSRSALGEKFRTKSHQPVVYSLVIIFQGQKSVYILTCIYNNMEIKKEVIRHGCCNKDGDITNLFCPWLYYLLLVYRTCAHFYTHLILVVSIDAQGNWLLYFSECITFQPIPQVFLIFFFSKSALGVCIYL